MRILVTHPGRQHSHRLVEALRERGMLAGYWTGVPAVDPHDAGPFHRLAARLSPQPTLGLPDRRVRHCYVAPITRRLGTRLLSRPQAVWWEHRSFAWFDRWAAGGLPLGSLDAVVCYENAALETFRRAKETDVVTVLDAASFHHSWQDAFYEPKESDRAHRAITRRKDREVELAGHVLTVSEFARESYLDAGVPPDRVTAVPLGADLSLFTPQRSSRRSNCGPFTFIFAGYADRRKGADVLLKASERLDARMDRHHRVRFAGHRDERLFRGTAAPVEPLGYLDRQGLAGAFRQADCLVLPSRHDSFGMVVVEAMAAGIPAMVSDHVGAKEAVREGETGWIVPPEDPKALADRMAWCIEHRREVRETGRRAAEAAGAYTWEAYRDRVADVLESVIRECVKPEPAPRGTDG